MAKGLDDDLWIGTGRGTSRMVGDDYHYFAGRRWLPDEQVNAMR